MFLVISGSYSSSDNKITEFPVMLCGLSQLDVVDLSGNQITAIPDGIEGLQAVEVNLNMNQVSLAKLVYILIGLMR